jgi:protein-disulfide isomerase
VLGLAAIVIPSLTLADTAPPKGVKWEPLSEAQRQLFLQIAEEQFCPCGKPRSFLDSLADSAGCPAVTSLGELLVAELAAGKSKKDAVRALLAKVANLSARFQFKNDGAHRKGRPDAPIQLVLFSDFECPHCRRAAAPILEVVSENKDVSVVFKHYPLEFHKNARAAAIAVEAAGKQGKFWEMHDAVFAHDDAPTPEVLESIAKKLKLDLAKWKADLAAPELAERVDANKREGDQAGIEGTPTIFVNGLLVEDLDKLEEKIAKERTP